MANNEINAQVKELRELKRMEEELAAQIEAIQDSLKAHMTELNTEELSGTDWKVTWRKVISARFDSTALKKAQPEIYAAYTKQTESRRFCLA